MGQRLAIARIAGIATQRRDRDRILLAGHARDRQPDEHRGVALRRACQRGREGLDQRRVDSRVVGAAQVDAEVAAQIRCGEPVGDLDRVVPGGDDTRR